MKITHIIIGLNGGGAELMLQRLVANDPSSLHSVISLTTCGIVGRKLIDKNISVFSMGMNKVNFLIVFFRLVLLLRQQKPQVVQTWMYHSDLFAGTAARLAGIRKVYWNVRNTEIPQGLFSVTSIIIRIASFISYIVPKKIICCGEAAKKSHINLGYCKRKMFVIPNGYLIDNSNISNSSKNFDHKIKFSNINSIVIGAVGRFDYLKGYDVLVNAAAHLIQNSDKNIIFLCIGKDVDWNNSILVSYINNFNLKNNFLLAGEIEELEHYYSLMDIFCLSSRAEGFPNVVAEAMLSSLPCVVTDVGDAAIIVGKHGIVVPKNAHIDMACALKHFVEMDPKIRNLIGNKGRSRIIENYNINDIVVKYNNLYQD
jgi:glycosyltransferase involved in cell wall biosynthesis